MRNALATLLIIALAIACMAPTYAQETPLDRELRALPSILVSTFHDESASDRKEASERFRPAFVRAVIAARKAGKIDAGEAVALRVASLSPAFLARAERLAVTQMVFSGEDVSQHVKFDESGAVQMQSIDWEGLADFLERVIPLVLQLLAGFGLI